MNSRQRTAAIKGVLDRECPDIAVEVLLLFGSSPRNQTIDQWWVWRQKIKDYLITRYRWKDGPTLEQVANVVERQVGHLVYNGCKEMSDE